MELDFEFERQAMKNEPMPKGLDYVDATIYQGFAWLYQRYYSGKISRDFAKKEKEKLLHAYKRKKEEKENERKMYEWHSDLMKRCENSARIYAKNPTLENADQLYADIYNLPKDWRA